MVWILTTAPPSWPICGDDEGPPVRPPLFSHTTQPHVYAIEESNRIEKPDVEYFCNGKLELKDAMHTILTQLYDAKEYGSILTITPQDWDALYARFDEVADVSSFHRESIRKNYSHWCGWHRPWRRNTMWSSPIRRIWAVPAWAQSWRSM